MKFINISNAYTKRSITFLIPISAVIKQCVVEIGIPIIVPNKTTIRALNCAQKALIKKVLILA